MKDIFDYQIMDTGTVPAISFVVNREKFEMLKEKILGKSIIYSDHADWETEKIVSAYRSQYHVEECFRQMKDTKHLGFRPLYHWTDKTVRVHAFYCVLTLLLCSILKKEIEKLGYPMSIDNVLENLSDVQQVITVFSEKKKRISKTSFSRLNGTAKEIIESLIC